MLKGEYKPLFYVAWLKLVLAYLISFALSFSAGVTAITIFNIAPEVLFEISTKRVSYVFPIIETGAALGIDTGILIFVWNCLGAVVTISFLYAAPLFNPQRLDRSPAILRQMLCGRKRMKLLCFLPGCMRIEAEHLRRVYVWLMIPWLGMLLLGFESGLTVSTSSYFFDSYLLGLASVVPHGIVEIPTLSFAGAVTFTAHLLVKEKVRRTITARLFDNIDDYIRSISLARVILAVVVLLLIAGLIEGHVTFKILDSMMGR